MADLMNSETEVKMAMKEMFVQQNIIKKEVHVLVAAAQMTKQQDDLTLAVLEKAKSTIGVVAVHPVVRGSAGDTVAVVNSAAPSAGGGGGKCAFLSPITAGGCEKYAYVAGVLAFVQSLQTVRTKHDGIVVAIDDGIEEKEALAAHFKAMGDNVSPRTCLVTTCHICFSQFEILCK
jgi:hypothetical protein